jgi:hypothetical protein
MRWCAPAVLSDRSPPLDAAFHSPAARASLATGSRSRVKRSRPTSSKRFGNPSPTRSVANSCSRSAFYLPRERRSTPATRCWGRLPDSPPVFGPPLPSRTFLSFGIKALSPTPFGNACSMGRPIFLRSPSREMFNDSPRDGSKLQIRYFPSSSLFLEPLGTNYIMHPNYARRQYENSRFAQTIFVFKTVSCGGSAVNYLCIKQTSAGMF